MKDEKRNTRKKTKRSSLWIHTWKEALILVIVFSASYFLGQHLSQASTDSNKTYVVERSVGTCFKDALAGENPRGFSPLKKSFTTMTEAISSLEKRKEELKKKYCLSDESVRNGFCRLEEKGHLLPPHNTEEGLQKASYEINGVQCKLIRRCDLSEAEHDAAIVKLVEKGEDWQLPKRCQL
jgi:hypothetical protein